MIRMRTFNPVPAGALALVLWLLAAVPVQAAPRTLYNEPIPSPSREHFANAWWDDTGFIGRIGIRVYNTSGTLLHDVELPEIAPALTDLLWINDDWVAAESTLGEQGTGYFYVHVPTGDGFLLEMVTLRADEEWEFSFALNDSVSSAALPNAAVGRFLLFPLLVPDLPTTSTGFFRPEFPPRLAEAANAFRNFRRCSGFRELQILAGPDIHPDQGALLLVRFDEEPRLVHIPMDTTAPARMLSRVRLEPLNEAVLQALECPEDMDLQVRWNDSPSGGYVVEAVTVREEENTPRSPLPLMRGRMEEEAGGE